MKKEILYYTDNRLDEQIAKLSQQSLLNTGIPIISVSLKPLEFGQNIVLPFERGWGTYFKQIVIGLEASEADIIYFAEHDVIYNNSCFDFIPPTDSKFYYNQNWIKIDWPYTKGVAWDADQVSGLSCDRKLALAHYRKILDSFDRENFNRKFEPGSGTNSESWKSKEPYIDIRQQFVMTKSKWSLDDFRDKRTAKNFREVELTKEQKLWD